MSFQQGDTLLALRKVAWVDKHDLDLQAKGNAIRIVGRKEISYPTSLSAHRCERRTGTFDRTLTVPMQTGTEEIKAEDRDGVVPTECDKPRAIRIS